MPFLVPTGAGHHDVVSWGEPSIKEGPGECDPGIALGSSAGGFSCRSTMCRWELQQLLMPVSCAPTSNSSLMLRMLCKCSSALALLNTVLPAQTSAACVQPSCEVTHVRSGTASTGSCVTALLMLANTSVVICSWCSSPTALWCKVTWLCAATQ